MPAKSIRQPGSSGNRNTLNKVFTEEMGMVFLSTAITCPLNCICNIGLFD